jgi:hypothetical protein
LPHNLSERLHESETDGKRIFLWLQLEKFNHLDNYALIEL